MMYIFSKKRIIFALVILLFSVSASANSLVSSDKFSAKTQMQQLMEVYKILMDEKRDRSILRTSFAPQKNSELNKRYAKSLRVTATAYTSHVGQTDSTPNIAAWGDRLRPGMKVIAVSRDLLKKYGLKHRQKVHIKGLDGEYVVLDKMNKRWRKKIDIYMGRNKRKAFQWGRRRVEILWD